MVYPKQLVQPPSPPKEAKTPDTAYSTAKPDDVASSIIPRQADVFSIICDMMGNYNRMIEAHESSIKKIEEQHAKDTAKLTESFDALLQHVKGLEERLGEIEDQAKTSLRDGMRMNRAVGTIVDTMGILQSRLGSVESRVSSIERLIVRSRNSRKRKRIEASQKKCAR